MTRVDALHAENPIEHPKGKRERRDVHGWLVLDKPVGVTSTRAVSAVKRLFQAKRAGHAGTLDPLASGVLPIALGEATKTVPFVMEGRKTYTFTIRWGEERDTDDAEGRVTATSRERPRAEDIRTVVPRFTGPIEQVPPRFSAIKIAGERAYDIAREGEIGQSLPRARLKSIALTPLDVRSRPDDPYGRMRQGSLHSGAGARHRSNLGLLWPCRGAAAYGGRSRSMKAMPWDC